MSENKRRLDWQKIRAEYISNPHIGYRELSEKYGVSLSTISTHAKRVVCVQIRLFLEVSYFTLFPVNGNPTRDLANKCSRFGSDEGIVAGIL